MKIEELVARQTLTELANKLFMYTDSQQWNLLQQEVFAKDIWFDMSSAGGGAPALLTAAAICNMWKDGFKNLDAVHHQAGQYIIRIDNNTADIYAYATATHYKKAATKGTTRVMIGSYNLRAQHTTAGWRLIQFKYNLAISDGNSTLE